MMDGHINWTALAVFAFFFLLVTVMGFWASRWQSGGAKHKGRPPR
jgi:SSS family solute:Na+ symporter